MKSYLILKLIHKFENSNKRINYQTANSSKKMDKKLSKRFLVLQRISDFSSSSITSKASKQVSKTKKFDTAYSKLSEIKLVTIGIASPDKIRQWAEKTLPNGKVIGQVLNANTLHHKSFKPQKGGLFCERIFGPLKDFECACGKIQKPNKFDKEKNFANSSSLSIPTIGAQERKYCPICDVEYTWSVIRRYQLGYIQLVSPVTHIWYLKSNPSYLSILLDMKKRYLEYITYCTESLTIENSIKGNVNRLTNNPSEILAAWTKLVQNEKQSRNVSNSLQFNEEIRRKHDFKKEKRLLLKPKKSQSWILLTLNSSKNFSDDSTLFIFKKFQFKMLNSLISNEITETLNFDIKDEILNSNFNANQRIIQKPSQKSYEKISIKRLIKTFPTSYYLFFSLQTFYQKQLLKLVFSETWNEIYLNAIKNSFKSLFFMKSFTHYLKLYSETLKDVKSLTFVEKDENLNSPSKKWVLLSKLKLNWYESYLNILRKFKSKNFLNLINFVLNSDSSSSQNKMDQILVTMIKNLIPNLTIELNQDLNFNTKLEQSCKSILVDSEFRKLKITINNLVVTIQKLIFFILINEKFNFNNLKKVEKDNSLKILEQTSTFTFSLNQFEMLSLSTCLKKNPVTFSKKLIHDFILSELTSDELTEISTFVLSKLLNSPQGTLLKSVPHGLVLIGEYQGNMIYLTNFTFSQNLKLYYSSNKVSETFSHSHSEKSHLKIKPNKLLNLNLAIPKKLDENEKTKKLVNNFYTVSHRERWIDAEWQNFVDYMTIPISLKFEGNDNFHESLNSTKFSGEEIYPISKQISFSNSNENKINENDFLKIIPSYKSRIVNFQFDPIFNSSLNRRELNSNFSNFSGPGIIQQLLKELDFSEQRKMDKQNRILLYQLNKYIFMLKKQIYKKSAKKELKECYKFRDQLIRRTKLIRTFFRKDSNPHSMILTILPVLPPDLRPIVKIGGQIAASDLNRLYQRVIYRNDRLKKFLKDPATSSSYEMKYAQRLLQESVDNLIQNGKSGVASEKDARGRALKSLSDLLKGKQGRFRQYLLGKRVDYSGRSVIVVGPKLKLHECGLPKEMALELYLPFLLKRILNHNYARTVVGAKTLIRKNPELTWELLKEIMQTCPVLLNRAPTLHRLGIQAFQPKLIEGRAILLHPLVCSAFNADFDGDQMAVHVPITVEARSEAWKLMGARNNFLSPATGEPLAIPSQDMVLGCYYLTTNCNKLNIKLQRGTGFAFSNFTDVLNAYHRQIIDLHSLVWVKFEGNLEQGNDKDEPIEIRINSFGHWNEIYQLNLCNYSNQNLVINQYICTTPGRILFNLIIQKNTLSTLFH